MNQSTLCLPVVGPEAIIPSLVNINSIIVHIKTTNMFSNRMSRRAAHPTTVGPKQSSQSDRPGAATHATATSVSTISPGTRGRAATAMRPLSPPPWSTRYREASSIVLPACRACDGDSKKPVRRDGSGQHGATGAGAASREKQQHVQQGGLL